MRIKVKDLRRLVREQVQLDELFGRDDLGRILDSVVQDLYDANKKVEKAHALAPAGPAKAIVMGLHSDLFNKLADFRKYVEQVKALAKKGQG